MNEKMHRQIPAAFTHQPGVSVSRGWVGVAVTLSGIALGLFGLWQAWQGGGAGWLILGLAALPLGLVLLRGCLKDMADYRHNQAQRRAWLSQSASARLEITDRHNVYDEYAGDMEYTLDLRLSHIGETGAGEDVLPVRVSRDVYEAYRQKDHAPIHYARQDPLMFIIEGEQGGG